MVNLESFINYYSYLFYMGLRDLLLGMAVAALSVGCAYNKPCEDRWAVEQVEDSKPVKYWQGLYVVPSAVHAVLQHEASHAVVAKWLGSQNIKATLYPHLHTNDDGFYFQWASVSYDDFHDSRKNAAVAFAGPLSDIIAGEGIKACLKNGLVGKNAEPFFASAALANDLAFYSQCFWAPLRNDMTDVSKDMKMSPWVWVGVGLAKAGYDVFIARDTENLVKCILGLRSYRKEEDSFINPIFGADGKNVYLGVGVKF